MVQSDCWISSPFFARNSTPFTAESECTLLSSEAVSQRFERLSGSIMRYIGGDGDENRTHKIILKMVGECLLSEESGRLRIA